MNSITFSSVKNALAQIQSGDRVFVHGGAATPNFLLHHLVLESFRLQNVELIHMHTEGPAEYANPIYKNSFKVVNLFVGANMRANINYEDNDYLPCFLSEMPSLFRKGIRPPRVALIQVSPPDSHGYCSLGTSVDIAKAAVDTAEIVIAQVNQYMPRVFGDGVLHVREIDFFVEGHEALPELHEKNDNKSKVAEKLIAQLVATLVDEGATLQMGIGSVPDAVLAALGNHRHLGIHTEMFSDGALNLIEKGVVDNSKKKIHPGKTVSTFLLGSRRLYDFIDDNPSVIQLDASYVNNPQVIARNPKVTSINSAIEIDLTGQVCADSVGNRIISGVGGQVDFIVGANLSQNGKAIIAMTSRSAKGQPRLVPQLHLGAGVVTTRAHVHYVVTEYGIAQLYGKTIKERAQSLIEIAHPDDRESLMQQWFSLRGRK